MSATLCSCLRLPSPCTRCPTRPTWACSAAPRNSMWANSSNSDTNAKHRCPSGVCIPSYFPSVPRPSQERNATTGPMWDTWISSRSICERTRCAVIMHAPYFTMGVCSLCGRPDSNRQGAIRVMMNPPHRGPSPVPLPIWTRPQGSGGGQAVTWHPTGPADRLQRYSSGRVYSVKGDASFSPSLVGVAQPAPVSALSEAGAVPFVPVCHSHRANVAGSVFRKRSFRRSSAAYTALEKFLSPGSLDGNHPRASAASMIIVICRGRPIPLKIFSAASAYVGGPEPAAGDERTAGSKSICWGLPGSTRASSASIARCNFARSSPMARSLFWRDDSTSEYDWSWSIKSVSFSLGGRFRRIAGPYTNAGAR